MNRLLKRKQFELLHNALGFMAADAADAEDSFHHGKHCSGYAQKRFIQIWVFSFCLQINTSESGNGRKHKSSLKQFQHHFSHGS